ncbi:MAG: AAA family ATPase, partial [Bacteroidota bacterium]
MAKKAKTIYFCKECGAEHIKWMGQCSACGAWGSLTEERITAQQPTISKQAWATQSTPKPIQEIEASQERRLFTPDQEMNRVLGGGIVLGSVVLLGGEPGIGKSTLLLQLALQMGPRKILYVSGEESESQIKLRADRLGQQNDSLFIAAETHLERILEFYEDLNPDLLVVDSIQTLYSEKLESAPGSVSQVRECTSRLLRLAKQSQTPVFLVGHITKEGMLAGPKVLEH